MTFDVWGEEKETAIDDHRCTTQFGRWNWESSGYLLVTATEPDDPGGWEYGIPSCVRSRVWVVDVDRRSVTIVATPAHPSAFEEVVATAEDLLASTSIGD